MFSVTERKVWVISTLAVLSHSEKVWVITTFVFSHREEGLGDINPCCLESQGAERKVWVISTLVVLRHKEQ